MQIKVQCPCGTRFEFEVEPVHERMPVPINCPACGVDATDLANAVIKQRSSQARPAVVLPMRATPPPRAAETPPPPSQSGLKIAKAASVSFAASASDTIADGAAGASPERHDAGAVLCPKHNDEPAASACVVCGKAMCLKCMEQFGHVCSVFCREQAAQKRVYVPPYAGQKAVTQARSNLKARLITFSVLAVIAVCIGLPIWYKFFGRNPKAVFTFSFPKAATNDSNPDKPREPSGFYQLIAPNQLLSVKDKSISLRDIDGQKILWSTPLQSETEPGRTASEDYFLFSNPHVIATSNDIWLSFRGEIARFDRQTGARKQVAIPGKILNVTPDDGMILALSANPDGRQLLTQITLPDGAVRSEEITSSHPAGAAAKPALKTPRPTGSVDKTPINAVKNALAPSSQPDEPDQSAALAMFEAERHPFIPAGPNAAQFETKLLESKTVTLQAMKPKGPSILDSGNVTASQGLDYAQEFINDAQRQRTGGVETEDVSRYQVTIHRRFAADVPDWSSEVIGPPQFIPLKTVDIVAGGQSIQVLNKSNKKLWDAKLTFPVSSGSLFDETQIPCLETHDALFFADKGMLTCFELTTGNARWRLNSVGISAVQADGQGRLYLDTAGADPDALKYSQQFDVRDKKHRFIMKVDPQSGKVLWRSERPADYYHCVLSGAFVYSIRNWSTQDMLRLEEGPDRRFSLTLLDPGTGDMIWTYPRINHGNLKTDIQQKSILLQFDDELVVLKFFSL